MKDVLDLFGELPDFPGKTKPKNLVEETTSKKNFDDPFAGVKKKTAVIKGEKVDLYTVGAAASVLGRTAATLRSWEFKGWIPPPKYRSSKSSGSNSVNREEKGYRLYSRAQVETLRNALEQNNLLGTRNSSWQITSNWLSFIEHIKANWPK
jgi:hypothetical protein